MKKAYTPIEIIIADDHEIYRDGLSAMIHKMPELKLTGEAENGAELIQLVQQLKPDVVITDIKMPKMDGIEATRQLKKEFPDMGIIALSMFDEEDLIIDMLEAGAKGYLLKNAHKDEIVAAVKTVHKDEPYYCRMTTHKLAQMIAKSNFNPHKNHLKPVLSKTEIAIIQFVCEGLSSKEIAERLQIGRRTVETHRENISEKIGAKNTAGIVVYALKNKLYQ